MTKPERPTAGDPAATDDALLFVDAIENDQARLLLGQQAFDVPARLLPPGAREGSWVRLSFKLTSAPPDAAAAIRRKLSQDDDGGDIKL